MKYKVVPTREELQKHAEQVPEINPPEVLAMLRVLQAADEIRSSIENVLEEKYQLSEGKLRVMIVLHQNPLGTAPSLLAQRTGVTRATISGMLRRMKRDGLVDVILDEADGRGKKIMLTKKGRDFMGAVLPDHYSRISDLMGKLTTGEQEELIRLMKKIVTP